MLLIQLNIFCDVERHIGKGVGKYIEKELFSARDYVLIASPDISPSLGEKLFEMTNHGIRVRVITSNTSGADSDKTNQYARDFVKPPKSYETDPTEWRPPPLEYKIVNTKEVSLIHAKIYVIDGKCAIFGSANLTVNSFWNFAEYIHITRDPAEIKEIEGDFETLWNSYHDTELEKLGVKKDVKEAIRKVRRKIS